MLRRFGQRIEHCDVQINGHVTKLTDHIKHLLLRDSLLKGRIDHMPQLSSLRLIAPVLAKKPADQRQVFDVMLAIKVGELRVKVA